MTHTAPFARPGRVPGPSLQLSIAEHLPVPALSSDSKGSGPCPAQNTKAGRGGVRARSCSPRGRQGHAHTALAAHPGTPRSSDGSSLQTGAWKDKWIPQMEKQRPTPTHIPRKARRPGAWGLGAQLRSGPRTHQDWPAPEESPASACEGLVFHMPGSSGSSPEERIKGETRGTTR